MSVPQKIGKYEILDKIGEGGFGVVYKGRDPFIKRLVAVKTCTSEEGGIQKRFFLEAEIAGNLHHDNVVTIHDFGVEEETPYLVQEFLEGEDLDLIIGRGDPSFGLREKVRCLRGIAEGLGYAHTHGVIHRDVKPSNIRVLDGGRVKVMDFGIAKLKDQESRLTATGMTVGTVAYLSPEQLRGEEIDHRADIFSFGVVAYELLTGQRPFRGGSINELFNNLLNEPPEPLDERQLVPGLAQVVERCLAKSADERYGHFSEVVVALDEVRLTLPGDPDETNPFWGGQAARSSTRGRAARLAAKALRAIEARDLTAAEMTVNIARREMEATTFEREFGPLLADLEALKNDLKQEAQSSPQLANDERQQIQATLEEIRAKLERQDLDGAAIALVTLEQGHPGLAELEPLHNRIAEIHRARQKKKRNKNSRPTAGESTAPFFGAGRVPTQGPFHALRDQPAIQFLRKLEPWQWAAIVGAGLLLVFLLTTIF